MMDCGSTLSSQRCTFLCAGTQKNKEPGCFPLNVKLLSKVLDFYSTGREQAELTGKRLASLGMKFDKIVYSSMTRATETTEIISKHLPGKVSLSLG